MPPTTAVCLELGFNKTIKFSTRVINQGKRVSDFVTKLSQYAPGKLLAVNMHLGKLLSLIPSDIHTTLIDKAAKLYSTVENDNSALGIAMLPIDAYSALFSTLQTNGDAFFFVSECACNSTSIQEDSALNVLRLDGLLSRYVSEAQLADIFSILDTHFPDPDEALDDVEKDELMQNICSFIAKIYSSSLDNKLSHDQTLVVKKLQNQIIKALHEHRPTFRTAVPFFWVGFNEPGRAEMTADELRDALGICWDKGTVLLEIRFTVQDSATTDALYFRPTAINSIASHDGKGGRFMACASTEFPVHTPRSWHGTTAHLGKFEETPNHPLDSFKELIRKPMPLDKEHLQEVRIVGVVRSERASDDATTNAFADCLARQFGLHPIPDISK